MQNCKNSAPQFTSPEACSVSVMPPEMCSYVFFLSRYRSLERLVYFRNHDNMRAVHAGSQEVNLPCGSGYWCVGSRSRQLHCYRFNPFPSAKA